MRRASTNRRRRDEKEVGFYYSLKFRWLRRCIYCGEPPTGHDHVMPISRVATLDLRRPNVRRELGQGLNRVPCCRECNSLAHDRPFVSIREKRLFIQEKLLDRYMPWILNVDWTPAQLANLGYTLRTDVLHHIAKSARINRRLAWPRVVD